MSWSASLTVLAALAAAGPSCASPVPSAAPADAMVQDAAGRSLAAPRRGPRLVVWLQVGDTARAARVAAALKSRLAAAGTDFTEARVASGAPVADAGRAGGHVHTVHASYDPPPDLVVVVSDRDGVLYIAARAPGPDPSIETGDWAWILRDPPAAAN